MDTIPSDTVRNIPYSISMLYVLFLCLVSSNYLFLQYFLSKSSLLITWHKLTLWWIPKYDWKLLSVSSSAIFFLYFFSKLGNQCNRVIYLHYSTPISKPPKCNPPMNSILREKRRDLSNQKQTSIRFVPKLFTYS